MTPHKKALGALEDLAMMTDITQTGSRLQIIRAALEEREADTRTSVRDGEALEAFNNLIGHMIVPSEDDPLVKDDIAKVRAFLTHPQPATEGERPIEELYADAKAMLDRIHEYLSDVDDDRPQKEGTYGLRNTIVGKIAKLKSQATQGVNAELVKTLQTILATLKAGKEHNGLSERSCFGLYADLEAALKGGNDGR